MVTVLEGGVEPRYPTVSGRMKAKKIAIEERPAAVTTPRGPKRVRLTLPPPVPNQVQILGEGPVGRRRASSSCSSTWGWPDDPRLRGA